MLLQAMFFDGLLYHGFILPHIAVEETVPWPRHNDVRWREAAPRFEAGELASNPRDLMLKLQPNALGGHATAPRKTPQGHPGYQLEGPGQAV
jgi:hypothetical protein